MPCLHTHSPASSSSAHRQPWLRHNELAAVCSCQHRHCAGSSWKLRRLLQRKHGQRLRVAALDAAMPFDFEARAQRSLAQQRRLKVGFVGFGKFGQFLAQRLVAAGHEVLATSRADYSAEAAALGVRFFTDTNDFCEEHPEVVVLAASIMSAEAVLRGLPLTRLKRSTLFVDVLSVKVFPKRLLLAVLPPEMDILCTHPMFGPDSGKGKWTGLNFMYDKVRVAPEGERQQRVEALLAFFGREGCTLVPMAAEEHDRLAASSQFITHTVGRVLGGMTLQPTAVDTRGFQSLLALVDNTQHDSFDLYYGLFMYNPNATEELERLEQAFGALKRELLARVHAVARQQLLFNDPAEDHAAAPPALPTHAAVAAALSKAEGPGDGEPRPAAPPAGAAAAPGGLEAGGAVGTGGNSGGNGSRGVRAASGKAPGAQGDWAEVASLSQARARSPLRPD